MGGIGLGVGRVFWCLWSGSEGERERVYEKGEREDGDVAVLEGDVKGHSGVRVGYSDLRNDVEGGLVVVAIEGTSYQHLSKQAEAEASTPASSNSSSQSAQATEVSVRLQET